MTDIRQTNPVREQMLGTSAAILQQFDVLESNTRKLLTTPEIFATRRIILTGCGDSQMAAASVEMAFELFAGVPVEALPAMAASRYAIPALENLAFSTLVIGISSSGAVARTVEAVRSARIRGTRTIALTSNPESPVGQAAERVLQMQSASLPSAPGFFGYMLSMVALQLLAIRMAEVKGRRTQDQAYALRMQLKRSIEAVPRVIGAVDDAVRDLAGAWATYRNVEILGSGPSYAAATFGAAKLLEAVGTHCWAQDLEEWAHLQYFVAEPDITGTLLISPTGAQSESRAIEISRLLNTLGRPSTAIIGPDSSAADFGIPCIVIPESIEEPFSPLLYTIPLTLFAGYLSDATGALYGRGHLGRWAESETGSTIRDSQIVVPPLADVSSM